MNHAEKRILFVRSGGGCPGIDIHMGIWMALQEAGIRATDVAGTSAGGVVAAMDSCGWGAPDAAAFCRMLTDADHRRERAAWKFRPWIDHFLEIGPLRRIVSRAVKHDWSDYYKPISLWATDVVRGTQLNVARPEVSAYPVESVLASMAISGVWPHIRLDDGNEYADGGVGMNLPVPANWVDFDEVYLLVATGANPAYKKTSGLLTRAIRNLQWAMQSQVEMRIQLLGHAPTVRVIWPKIIQNNGMLRWDHALIEMAYELTRLEIARHV